MQQALPRETALVMQVPYEGRTWTLLRQGTEHKIEDKELAAQLEYDPYRLRQRIGELAQEDPANFDPEYRERAAFSTGSVEIRGRGRPGGPQAAVH